MNRIMAIVVPPYQQVKLASVPAGSLIILGKPFNSFGICFDAGGTVGRCVVFQEKDATLVAAAYGELSPDVLLVGDMPARARPADLREFKTAIGPQDISDGALVFHNGDWQVRARPTQVIQQSGSIRVSLQTFAKINWVGPTAIFYERWQLLLMTDANRPEFDQKIWVL